MTVLHRQSRRNILGPGGGCGPSNRVIGPGYDPVDLGKEFINLEERIQFSIIDHIEQVGNDFYIEYSLNYGDMIYQGNKMKILSENLEKYLDAWNFVNSKITDEEQKEYEQSLVDVTVLTKNVDIFNIQFYEKNENFFVETSLQDCFKISQEDYKKFQDALCYYKRKNISEVVLLQMRYEVIKYYEKMKNNFRES